MNSESVVLSDKEMSILNEISNSEHISTREALSRAIFFLASKVDYTENLEKDK